MKPKGVFFVTCLLSAYAVFLLAGGLIPYPYTSRPWTDYASTFVICVGMLYFGRMVRKQNLIAVATVAGALFCSVWMLISIAAAVGLIVFPMVLLAWPSNIRWLRANSRFSVLRMISMVVLVFACGVLYFTPSMTADCISNMSPIGLFAPGDKPIHGLDESGQHIYAYWKHGCNVGVCRVQYNEDRKCGFMNLDMYASAPKRGEDYEAFVLDVKDECGRCFGNEIEWSETVTDGGLVMVIGRIRDELAIKILPNENEAVLGSALIYSPRLCHEPSPSELEMANARAKRIMHFIDEANAALKNGDSPEKVAKVMCQNMSSLSPPAHYDELATANFFRMRGDYSRQIEKVMGEIAGIWEKNSAALTDKSSDDYVFNGGSGCQLRLNDMKLALDRWVLEQNRYFQRMEGAGRIFFSGEMEGGFGSYVEGLSRDRNVLQDLTQRFKRLYEILLVFAQDGLENPNVETLMREYDDTRAQIYSLAQEIKSTGTGAGVENGSSP